MHLLALTQWIRAEGGGRVRFIARDGYLPMRAYALLYGREGTEYLHVSRRALLPVTLLLGGGPALFEANVAPGETPRSLCAQLRPLLSASFWRELAEAELVRAGGAAFRPDVPFAGEAELHRFVADALLPNLDAEACARYRSALAGYFSARLGDGDACFDVGYSGRTLHILAVLTGLRLRGLFVHDYGDGARALLAARGVSVRTFYDFAPAVAGHIRELLLSDVAPSCIGYAVGEEGARPLFEPARLHYAAEFTLRSVQDAALAFVADMRRIFGDALEGMPLRAPEASAPLEYCLLYSSEEDRSLFAPVVFEDRMYTGKEPSLLGRSVAEGRGLLSERGFRPARLRARLRARGGRRPAPPSCTGSRAGKRRSITGCLTARPSAANSTAGRAADERAPGLPPRSASAPPRAARRRKKMPCRSAARRKARRGEEVPCRSAARGR